MDMFFNNWLPLIYLYLVGGIFFTIGIVLIKKSGAIDLTKKRNRTWYKILIFGFIYFVLIHTILTILALYY